MKNKSLLSGIGFILFFFIVINLVRQSCKNKTYYEPKKYVRTINDSICGIVTRIVEGKNFFGVEINSDTTKIYPFTYHLESTPKEWQANYPNRFILKGDSIIKEPQSDTFTVARNGKRWVYLLPDN